MRMGKFVSALCLFPLIAFVYAQHHPISPLGNKVNFLEPSCLKELQYELGSNSSRLIEVLIQGQAEEMARNVAKRTMADVRTQLEFLTRLDQTKISYDIKYYLQKEVQQLATTVREYSLFVNGVILDKMCSLWSCCYPM